MHCWGVAGGEEATGTAPPWERQDTAIGTGLARQNKSRLHRQTKVTLISYLTTDWESQDIRTGQLDLNAQPSSVIPLNLILKGNNGIWVPSKRGFSEQPDCQTDCRELIQEWADKKAVLRSVKVEEVE